MWIFSCNRQTFSKKKNVKMYCEKKKGGIGGSFWVLSKILEGNVVLSSFSVIKLMDVYGVSKIKKFRCVTFDAIKSVK